TQLRSDQHRRELRLLRRVEHAEQGLVDMTDTELRNERKNASRYAFKDRFDVLPALFQFRIGGGEFFAGGFELASVRGEFRRHLIEGCDKVPQFVGSGNLDAIIEITARNLLSCFSKSYDRAGDQTRAVKRQPHAGEEHHAGDPPQKNHVSTPHSTAGFCKFQVPLLAGLELLLSIGEVLR